MFSRLITLSLCAIILSSCAHKFENKKPDNHIWSNQENKIALVQISSFEGPEFHRIGGQGFLDQAVNIIATHDVSESISKIDYQNSINTLFYDKYSEKIHTLGAKPTPLTQSYFYKDLTELDAKKQEYPYSLNFLKQKGFTHTLIFQPLSAGTSREYHGFIPLSSPQGMAHFNFYIVDLRTNMVVGFYYSASFFPCVAEWDTPPHYKALTKSSVKSFKNALEASYEFFFDEENETSLN